MDRHEGAAKNTDRELWRERPGDYYADSIHVTAGGGIGINCGDTVIVKPVREWRRLAERGEAALAAWYALREGNEAAAGPAV